MKLRTTKVIAMDNYKPYDEVNENDRWTFNERKKERKIDVKLLIQNILIRITIARKNLVN